ncbi:MAG TPA: RING finger protein [Pyrinomonadaceae bacterium]|jgi:hypothetical protein
MTGMVRRLKINKRYATAACAWCGDALALAEDGVVCEACETPHHARCWDERNGCGQTSCINAPLRQDPTASVWEEQSPLHEMPCPHCRKSLPVGTSRCPDCQRFTTPSGLYEGERKTSGEARDAFFLGLFGVFVPPILNLVFMNSSFQSAGVAKWLPLFIGLRCGWNAIQKAGVAKIQISNDQTLKGAGLATAAKVLGCIALALPVLGIVIFILVLMNGG